MFCSIPAKKPRTTFATSISSFLHLTGVLLGGLLDILIDLGAKV